jgi:hypothetical protein
MLVLGIRAETDLPTPEPSGTSVLSFAKALGGNPKAQGELVETWIGLWIILLFVTDSMCTEAWRSRLQEDTYESL